MLRALYTLRTLNLQVYNNKTRSRCAHVKVTGQITRIVKAETAAVHERLRSRVRLDSLIIFAKRALVKQRAREKEMNLNDSCGPGNCEREAPRPLIGPLRGYGNATCRGDAAVHLMDGRSHQFGLLKKVCSAYIYGCASRSVFFFKRYSVQLLGILSEKLSVL